MPKGTLEQKRLEQLRRQLKGSPTTSYRVPKAPEQPTYQITNIDQVETNTTSFLRRDLIKVLTLALAAIAVELTIYFAQARHFLNLRF